MNSHRSYDVDGYPLQLSFGEISSKGEPYWFLDWDGDRVGSVVKSGRNYEFRAFTGIGYSDCIDYSYPSMQQLVGAIRDELHNNLMEVRSERNS